MIGGASLQIVGTLEVHVAVLPGTTDARTLARARFGPAEVRDAYRRTLLGTHYTIEVPIDVPIQVPIEATVTEAVARIVFTDAITGRSHTDVRAMVLEMPRPSEP